MTSTFRLQPHWFAPPGAFHISPAALDLARRFLDEARAARPGQDLVVGFDWGSVRRVRERNSASQWRDLGPGFDVAVFERRQIPEPAIARLDGLEVTVQAPERLWESGERPTIDVDASAPGGIRVNI